MEIEELYQEVILEGSRAEHNRGDLADREGAMCELVYNPLCGDNVQLWIQLTEGRLKDIKFSGQGCAISQAAASLIADSVRGRLVSEVNEFIETYEKLLKGEHLAVQERAQLGAILALEGVRKFPSRVRCALIALEALKKLLLRAIAS